MPIEQAHVFEEPAPEQRAELGRRALAAWFGGAGAGPDSVAHYITRKGLGYVRIQSAGATLAVYRVRSDNLMLRRMKRPPGDLAES